MSIVPGIMRRMLYESMRQTESYTSTWAVTDGVSSQGHPLFKASLEPVLEPHEQRTDELDDSMTNLVMRLVCWERGSGQNAEIVFIRDVKEQCVFTSGVSIDRSGTENGARVANFVEALKQSVLEVLTFQTLDQICGTMPYDYFRFAFSALQLKQPGTVEEFKTVLRTKGRLGRWL